MKGEKLPFTVLESKVVDVRGVVSAFGNNTRRFEIAKNKIKPEDDRTNKQNPNRGTDGTNLQWDKMNGNRGKQIQQEMNKKQGAEQGEKK